jgi:hypothetical protein
MPISLTTEETKHLKELKSPRLVEDGYVASEPISTDTGII